VPAGSEGKRAPHSSNRWQKGQHQQELQRQQQDTYGCEVATFTVELGSRGCSRVARKLLWGVERA
jgi:hypothetical protein